MHDYLAAAGTQNYLATMGFLGKSLNYCSFPSSLQKSRQAKKFIYKTSRGHPGDDCCIQMTLVLMRRKKCRKVLDESVK